MSTSELADRLERRTKAVRKAIRRKAWQTVPQPAGELGVGIYYWRREKAEAWIQQAKNAPSR